MSELPRQSYSLTRHGVTDQMLAEKNAENGSRLNRVEMDVICAVYDGHDDVSAVVQVTGLTKGQVLNALGVLREQGMVAR